MKARHILTWHEGEYYPPIEDIPKLITEGEKVVDEFLVKELKWKEKERFQTRWSPNMNMMWVTFNDEFLVKALFQRQAELENNRIRLIRYTPPRAYERNRELEIQTRLAREEDPQLRTQIRLGSNDFILRIKKKGERFYREVPINTFGPIPALNFIVRQDFSPGEPKGRRRYSSDESVKGGEKRKRKSNSSDDSISRSNTKNPRPNINDISDDLVISNKFSSLQETAE